MWDYQILVIGNRKEKGKALEQQFGYVLNHLGYIKLRFNIHRTGEEIDVKGFSKLFNNPLIAECKAHKDEINTPDLRKFFATFQTDYDKNLNTHGIFLSISGFNSTAQEWYEERIIENKKENFQLLNNKNFIDILKQEDIICSLDLLKSKEAAFTSLEIINRELLISDRGLFWKITAYAHKSDKKYIFFLDSHGFQPKKTDILYLLERINLEENEDILDVKDKHKILVDLYDYKYHTIDDLRKSTKQSREDIGLIIDELNAEGLIVINNNKIKLKKGLPWIIIIFKESKEISNSELIKLMLSEYYSVSIEDIIDQIESRFKLKIATIEKREIISFFLKISPSCVDYCLFGDTEFFENCYNQMIKDKNPSKEIEQKYQKFQYQFLIDKIVLLILFDHFQEPINKNLNIKEDINTIIAKLNIKFGSEEGLKANVETIVPYIFLKPMPGQSIKKGELVAAANKDSLIYVGNCFLGVEEYDLAIKQYNRVIEMNEHLPKIKAILNKSCAYIRMEDFNKANEILEKLKMDSDLFKEVKNNPELLNVYEKNKSDIKEKPFND